jgi:hypothetical protein
MLVGASGSDQARVRDLVGPTRRWKTPAVTARALMVLFDAVYLIALAAWVGSVLFVSFGVAPIIFRVLEPEAAGRFVRALFPRYYAWGSIAGAVALPASVAVPLCFPELRGPWVGVQALAILAGTLIMLYAGNSLTPAINAARDEGPAGRSQFERLHRRSVRLNTVVLLLGLGLLVAFAARPRPRTSGIVELSPQERVRREAAALERRPLADRPAAEDAEGGRGSTPAPR